MDDTFIIDAASLSITESGEVYFVESWPGQNPFSQRII